MNKRRPNARPSEKPIVRNAKPKRPKPRPSACRKSGSERRQLLYAKTNGCNARLKRQLDKHDLKLKKPRKIFKLQLNKSP